MGEFVLYGLDGDGHLLLTERFEAPDVAAAAAHGAQRRQDLPSVEIWQENVCVFRSRPVVETPPALRGKLAKDPITLAAGLAAGEAQSLDVAVIVTDAEGTIAFWNAAAEALYGWTSDDAIGRNILQVTPALQSRESAEEIMRALQAGKPWQGEIILRHRDGRPFNAFVIDIPATIHPGHAGLIVGVSAPAAQRAKVLARNRTLRAELDRLMRSA